ILFNIARYIPLFKPSKPNELFEPYSDYTPKNLYPCLLVSRLWYQCFLPHLYHYFVDSVMTQSRLPRPVLLKHRPYFRRVILDNPNREFYSDRYDLIDLPTNLQGLSVNSVDGDACSYMHALRTACGPRLRELTWSGLMRFSPLDTPWQFLGVFSALQHLELIRWYFTSDQLRAVLLGCSQTLRSLRMHSVSGYDQEVFCNNDDQPPLELTALRELYLMLDELQSRAVVHLPRVCPALEVLHLDVDLEEFGLQVMINHCQQYCPRLHTIHYYEGNTMRNERGFWDRGYYPEPELYTYLFKHSTRHLRSAIIPLPNRLDSHMLDALQCQARTLERIELRMKRGSTLSTSMLALLLEKTTALKCLIVDEANFGVQHLERLCQQPWVCRDLKTLVIKGYLTKREQWDEIIIQLELDREPTDVTDVTDAEFDDITTPEARFVYSDMAHRMYESDGQGWYLQPGLSERCYARAAKERAIKKKLFEHMYSSGLHQVSRITLNSTDLFAEEQPPAATDSDSENDSASDSES
ncbi:hypothetical protein BGZ68_001989, partial [Mortierella alpina]